MFHTALKFTSACCVQPKHLPGCGYVISNLRGYTWKRGLRTLDLLLWPLGTGNPEGICTSRVVVAIVLTVTLATRPTRSTSYL